MSERPIYRDRNGNVLPRREVPVMPRVWTRKAVGTSTVALDDLCPDDEAGDE